jgi:hypothetical protein
MVTTPVRTRPRTILVFGLVAAALVLAGLALVDPTAAQSEPTTTTTTPATAAPTTVPPSTPPPPREVLLVGDSIMKSTGPALEQQLGSGYRVHNEGVNGSGLLTPDVFDWPAQLPASLNQFSPDVVVMLFIGNYTSDPAQMWVGDDGRAVPDVYAPAFAREWGQQAERYVTRMISTGAEVVLVLPPPMITARVQRVTDRLRAEYQAVAARHPDVTLVDAATAVGGPDGEWIATRLTAAGIPAPVRVADTVHLADHGPALVAHEIHLGIRQATPSL